MYADRYTQPSRFNPAGLTAAIAINAGVVAALIFSAPTIIPRVAHDPLTLVDVFTPEPSPEPVPKPPEQVPPRQTTERIEAPIPPVAMPSSSDFTLPDLPPVPPVDPAIGDSILPLAKAEPLPPPPLPALIEPAFDSRYVGDLQPVYPASERRAGHEGRVTIRVLVGVDGRVKRAERVSATSDAFWQAAQDQALAKWRFKPGTRGGIPVEAWRTLTLTFVLEE
jgi:protein TonB